MYLLVVCNTPCFPGSLCMQRLLCNVPSLHTPQYLLLHIYNNLFSKSLYKWISLYNTLHAHSLGTKIPLKEHQKFLVVVYTSIRYSQICDAQISLYTYSFGSHCHDTNDIGTLRVFQLCCKLPFFVCHSWSQRSTTIFTDIKAWFLPWQSTMLARLVTHNLPWYCGPLL